MTRYRYAVTDRGTRIPFERIVLDSRALTIAADQYEEQVSHVDEVALGQAILTYLEAAEQRETE